MKKYFLIIALCAGVPAFAANVNAPNPEAISAVKTGERNDANAAWWGFNSEDATEALQQAIDSGALKVTVPFMGAPWIVRPIKLRSDIDIIFEPGVEVVAKKDEFKGTGDSLFRAANCSNIIMRGYNATLRMHKSDYAAAPYKKGEWRMVLAFTSCTNVLVEGLTLASSGGDGIYLGVSNKDQPYCKDVVIRDVTCDDNYRQGISVISAENLLIENCRLTNTSGTGPAAGIDLEPNHESERLVNCVIRNCYIAGNEGAGLQVYLRPLDSTSPPLSVLFDRCFVDGGDSPGIMVAAIRDGGPQGYIEFKDCVVRDIRKAGISIYDKSADSAEVRFNNCHLINTAEGSYVEGEPGANTQNVPISLLARRSEIATSIGGISFENCHVYDTKTRPVVLAQGKEGASVSGIVGNLVYHGPGEPMVETSGLTDTSITLSLEKAAE
ncbi:MAG: right-handed parallel beta-helix repeat-containing protein [Candidatus Hydrogenedentes bacterium]|nr:right-handed parallel beta-helix repeat-containing protein [Candidatus Hydrogenedentota bacterium]